LSEYIQLMANEPSIGLYHVEEHIRKTVPRFVEIKVTSLFHYFNKTNKQT